MTKKISRVLLVIMILTNVYLIYRINANTMSIASYDAGISQRSGVGQLESFWTKYVGGSKSYSTTYEDRERAEADSNHSIIALFVLDAVFIGALHFLNKSSKVKETPLTEEEKRRQRWERRHLK